VIRDDKWGCRGDVALMVRTSRSHRHLVAREPRTGVLFNAVDLLDVLSLFLAGIRGSLKANTALI